MFSSWLLLLSLCAITSDFVVLKSSSWTGAGGRSISVTHCVFLCQMALVGRFQGSHCHILVSFHQPQQSSISENTSLSWVLYWNLYCHEFKIRGITFLLPYKENCRDTNAEIRMHAYYWTTAVSRRLLVQYFHLKRTVTAGICASRQFNESLFTISDQVSDSCKMFTATTKAQALNMSETTMSLTRIMDQKLCCLLLGKEFQQHKEFVCWAQWNVSFNSAEWEMGLWAATYAVPLPPVASSHRINKVVKDLQNPPAQLSLCQLYFPSMTLRTTSTSFLNTSRESDHHLPGQPVPAPDHPFREEIYPNVQPEPLLV